MRTFLKGELEHAEGLSEQFLVTANVGNGTNRLRKLSAMEKVVSHPADREEETPYVFDGLRILPAEFAILHDLSHGAW
jgi:hypothetical protein